jgi:uncharacterized protein YndB with AHSA1/START domain
MSKLYVNKSIEINAPASKVWRALTDPAFTREWVPEFGVKGTIEADWSLGGVVRWKDRDGKTFVEGSVTGLQVRKFLRFTVFDVRSAERPAVSEEDGITYRLTEENGKTRLSLSQGDFSVMAEGEKYRNMSAEIWDRVLRKVKVLAEK